MSHILKLQFLVWSFLVHFSGCKWNMDYVDFIMAMHEESQKDRRQQDWHVELLQEDERKIHEQDFNLDQQELEVTRAEVATNQNMANSLAKLVEGIAAIK